MQVNLTETVKYFIVWTLFACLREVKCKITVYLQDPNYMKDVLHHIHKIQTACRIRNT